MGRKSHRIREKSDETILETLSRFDLVFQAYHDILRKQEETRRRIRETEKAIDVLERQDAEKAFELDGPFLIESTAAGLIHDLRQRKSDAVAQLDIAKRQGELTRRTLDKLVRDVRPLLLKRRIKTR
jgi:chaperonin cofactor prefoldin